MNLEPLRIGNIMFKKASYLCKEPPIPSYHINRCLPNDYYGRESEYTKEGDYYVHPELPYLKVHKSCFKNPESCYAIASFDYNERREEWKFSYIGDRPLELSEEETKDFLKIIKYGFEQLKNYFKEYE